MHHHIVLAIQNLPYTPARLLTMSSQTILVQTTAGSEKTTLVGYELCVQIDMTSCTPLWFLLANNKEWASACIIVRSSACGSRYYSMQSNCYVHAGYHSCSNPNWNPPIRPVCMHNVLRDHDWYGWNILDCVGITGAEIRDLAENVASSGSCIIATVVHHHQHNMQLIKLPLISVMPGSKFEKGKVHTNSTANFVIHWFYILYFMGITSVRTTCQGLLARTSDYCLEH